MEVPQADKEMGVAECPFPYNKQIRFNLLVLVTRNHNFLVWWSPLPSRCSLRDPQDKPLPS
jgi:hypothetical protein